MGIVSSRSLTTTNSSYCNGPQQQDLTECTLTSALNDQSAARWLTHSKYSRDCQLNCQHDCRTVCTRLFQIFTPKSSCSSTTTTTSLLVFQLCLNINSDSNTSSSNDSIIT